MSDTTIRELNDRFRTKLEGGRLRFAGELAKAAKPVLENALLQVIHFDDFTSGNEPEGERDFGGFILDGRDVFWKIYYYDNDLERPSQNPADPTLTTRILTISYADDFEGDPVYSRSWRCR